MQNVYKATENMWMKRVEVEIKVEANVETDIER